MPESAYASDGGNDNGGDSQAFYRTQIRKAAEESVVVSKSEFSKRALFTTKKLSKAELETFLDDFKKSLAHTLSGYGLPVINLDVVNGSSDVDQCYVIELDLRMSGNWPDGVQVVLNEVVSETLNELKQSSPVLTEVHQFDMVDPSEVNDATISNVESMVSKTKRLLVQDQVQVYDKHVCEWVYIIPQLETHELDLFLRETEDSIKNVFEGRGLQGRVSTKTVSFSD